MVKTRTWILILGAILALCLGLGVKLLMPGEAATQAEILSGGQVVRRVDLRIDQQFVIEADNGGENVVTVRDGKIGVTQATCPDHYCMHRGFCNSGAQIVCLPNKLVIRFLGEQEIDIIVG